MELTTHLIEDRNALISPWGKGNSKLGSGIYTYSKLPDVTCPGATSDCLAFCYAMRLRGNKPVWELLKSNTDHPGLPSLPSDAKIVRIHVSGDFDSTNYISSWIDLCRQNQQCTFFGYTRSWRVDDLLSKLEVLRHLPNVHLWASVDQSSELPPSGWRIAWIDGDSRLVLLQGNTYVTPSNNRAHTCFEQLGTLPSCEDCTYCFQKGTRDLVFLQH